MLNRKSFTFIELIIGLIALAIIVLAAGKLFTLQTRLIGPEFPLKLDNDTQYQKALAHMINNIHNSAYMEIRPGNMLILHSHSYEQPITPDMGTIGPRQYALVQNPDITTGDLYYFDGYSRPAPAGSVLIAENIQVPPGGMFVGEGAQKPKLRPGNFLSHSRYKKVKIEFWENSDPNASNEYINNDIFYAKAHVASQEDWDIGYVHPEHPLIQRIVGWGSSAYQAYQDGTRRHPFIKLEDMLDIASEYPAFSETIVVLSEEHQLGLRPPFSASYELKSTSFYFAPQSSLVIFPGTTLKMGYGTRINMKGSLTAQGEPDNKIFFTSLNEIRPPGSEEPDTRWKGISITNRQNPLQLSYLDISNALVHDGLINITPPEGYLQVVEIKNSYIHNNEGSLIIVNGAQQAIASGNTFSDNSDRYNLMINNDNGDVGDATGKINYFIYGNEFEGSYGIKCFQNADSSAELNSITVDVYGNDFTGGITGIHFVNSGNVACVQKAHDNTFLDTYISVGGGTQYDSCDNINSNSQILIKNNDINDTSPVYGISVYDVKTKTVISNNKISNTTGAYAIGVSKTPIQDRIIIKNNHIHNGTIFIYSVLPSTDVYAKIVNNVFYGTGKIHSRNARNADNHYITLTNNTLFGLDVVKETGNFDIKNCIIWPDGNGGGTVSDNLKSSVTYSDVSNVGSGTGNIAPPEDPKPYFVGTGDHPYDLDLDSIPEKDKWKGDDQTEMGAYGGTYGGDDENGWGPGVGRQ